MLMNVQSYEIYIITTQNSVRIPIFAIKQIRFMESFSDLIKSRRSTRKFTSEELTQDEVVTLLKSALMAPSSKRSNCWQFVAVDDKATLAELAKCKEQSASFIA